MGVWGGELGAMTGPEAYLLFLTVLSIVVIVLVGGVMVLGFVAQWHVRRKSRRLLERFRSGDWTGGGSEGAVVPADRCTR